MRCERVLPALVGLALLLFLGCQGGEVATKGATRTGASNRFAIEYVTAPVSLRPGDVVGVQVLNYTESEQACEVELFQDTQEGPRQMDRTEGRRVHPRSVLSTQVVIKAAGEYWLAVRGNTANLAAQATFQTPDTGGPKGSATNVLYKPGDFLKVDNRSAGPRIVTARADVPRDKVETKIGPP